MSEWMMDGWINQFFLILLISLSLFVCDKVPSHHPTPNSRWSLGCLPPPAQRSDWVVASVALRWRGRAPWSHECLRTTGAAGHEKRARPAARCLHQSRYGSCHLAEAVRYFSFLRLSERLEPEPTQVAKCTPIKNFALISRSSLARPDSLRLGYYPPSAKARFLLSDQKLGSRGSVAHF